MIDLIKLKKCKTAFKKFEFNLQKDLIGKTIALSGFPFPNGKSRDEVYEELYIFAIIIEFDLMSLGRS